MRHIQDYFLVGDLHTAALISENGSVDWLCVPDFESPSVFARILDPDGGTCAIEMAGYTVAAQYVRDTAIVEHVYRAGKAEFRVRSFMLSQPTEQCSNHFLVFNARGLRGNARLQLRFDPRPDYARAKPDIERVEHGLRVAIGNDALVLHVPDGAAVRRAEKGSIVEATLRAGEEKRFVLEYAHQSSLLYCGQDFEKVTRAFWHSWVARGHYFTFCRDGLVRSAITLKLMQFYPTGAIIAAPTTSLPEVIDGVRNWDYRYVWIRDATFTLYALHVLGYTDEASRFFAFVERAVAECAGRDIDVRLMYTIRGKPVPQKETLDHLLGYRGSQPVQIGNGATDQFQLDVYGSLIDAHYFMWRRGVQLTQGGRKIIFSMLNKIRDRWREPDSSIWEVQSGPEHFTYSKVMAWVGVNRALELRRELGMDAEQEAALRALEAEIKHWVWAHCYDENSGILRQHPETNHQDATNFLMVLVWFLEKNDPRTRIIIENTCRELLKREVFVDRYHAPDGFSGSEGSFILCTFWLISARAVTGDIEQARRLFEKFRLRIASHKLLAEEIDAETGDYLGNYPQAFSHMGYIMSAYYLDCALRKKGKEG